MTAILDADALAKRARAASDYIIPCETGMPLVDCDIDAAAAFLAPLTWAERASWVNSITVGSLENMVELFDADCRTEADHQPFVAACMRDMRASIGLILERLEEIASRPKTQAAMLLYRLSHDERHVRAAAAWFETEDAELRAFEPGSGLIVLRHLSLRLDELGATPIPMETES